MLLVLNLPLVGIFARVAAVPSRLLMPAVLVLCIVGAYGDNNNVFDVWVMVAAGVAGFAMRRFGYEPAPLVLGLVLGPIMERSLLQSLIMGRGELHSLAASPLSALLLAAAVLAALLPLASGLWGRLKRGAERPRTRTTT
jgi:putative tricarboxylic transport membrane protein